MKKRLIVTAGMLSLLIAACLWSTYESQLYYARELAHAHSSEQVRIDGVAYDVVDGNVSESGKAVGDVAAWRPRKLAYEVELARLDPFFSIAGTDPKNLKTEAALLAQLEEKYASAQKSATTSRLMYSLYPISFLNALADLEEKRQTLLAKPTEANATAYELAAEKTASLKIGTIDAFQSAFARTVSPTFSVYLFDGVLTGKNELATIAAYKADASATRAQVEKRSECLAGWFAACSDSLRIPSFINTKDTSADFPTVVEKEILGLWREVLADSKPSQAPVVRLSQSACLHLFNPPYDVLASYNRTSTGNIFELVNASDVLFTPTDQSDAMYWTYAREQLGMSYSPADIFMYYVCPQIGIDVGQATALVHIAAFASSHPSLAPVEREQLTNPDRLSEYAAKAYLDAAIAQAQTERGASDLHSLEELALMEKGGSGGLDQIAAEIVHVGTTDTDLKLPIIDTSAQTTYATHSAFPSFFRIGAQDGLLDGLFTATSSVHNVLLPHLSSYWQLRLDVPRSKLIHDLRAYLLFEGRYLPTPTDSTSTRRS